MVKNSTATTGFGRSIKTDVKEEKSRNLAKAYAWWIAKAGLSLAILKVRMGNRIVF